MHPSAALPLHIKIDTTALKPPHFEAIPEKLRRRPQWVVWRLEVREEGEKPTKVLYSSRNGYKARTHNAEGKEYKTTAQSTWSSFEQARHAYQHNSNSNGDRYDGIGYVFTSDDPFAGLDLDDCVDADGSLLPWAASFVKLLGSYTEVSPSGTGLKIIAEAKKPVGRCRNGNVEFYDQKRFFALTGHCFPDTAADIQSRQAEYTQAWERTFPPQEKAQRPPSTGRQSTPTDPSHETGEEFLSDIDLLSVALRAKNGSEIAALISGDTSAYDSASEADSALAHRLAFYTDCPTQLERMMRSSGLVRPKWEEARGATTWLRAYVVDPALERVTVKYSRAHSPQPKAEPTLGDPEKVEEVGIFEPLSIALSRLERKLRDLGVSTDPCKPMFPPDTDREDIQAIGEALKYGTERVVTTLNFLWGRWYCSLPTRYGVRKRMIEELFGVGSLKALNEVKRIPELGSVVRRVPCEYWNLARPWQFYAILAQMSPERQQFWHEQTPFRGMYSIMDEELQKGKPQEEKTPKEDTDGGSSDPSPSTSHCEHILRGCSSSGPAGDVTLTVRASIAERLDRLNRCAEQNGLSLEAFLDRLLEEVGDPEEHVDGQVDEPTEISVGSSTCSTCFKAAPVENDPQFLRSVEELRAEVGDPFAEEDDAAVTTRSELREPVLPP